MMTATADLDFLDFLGEPFDAGQPGGQSQPRVPPTPAAGQPSAAHADPVGVLAVSGHKLLRRVRAALIDAHTAAMRVQAGLVRAALAELSDGAHRFPTSSGQAVSARRVVRAGSGESVLARLDVVLIAPGELFDETGDTTVPQRPSSVHEFKPLTFSARTALSTAELARLVDGQIDAVFGTAHNRSFDQQDVNPAISLSDCPHGGLVEVTNLDVVGGHWGQGRLTGRCVLGGGSDDALPAGLVDGGWQAAQVLALRLGLHLCLADAHFEVGTSGDGAEEAGNRLRLRGTPPPGEYTLDAEAHHVGLVPRPHLRLSVRLYDDDRVVAEMTGLTLTVREREGARVGPGPGGRISGQLARRNTAGEAALLNEFHMAHASVGDLGVTMGPEFHRYLGRRATRMPSGGLRLCDRIMSLEGTRGELGGGAVVSEYDSPASSWYYREYASATMPHAILLETSLQSALMMGYYLGPTLVDPDTDYSLRNLEGRATVLREVDLCDATIRQRSRLVETTVLSGAVLQSFDYELSVDGVPFYAGESLFGFFSAAALANQTGMDGGRSVPNWLDAQVAEGRRPVVRTVKIDARPQGRGGPGPSRDHLALISAVEVVDNGGQFGLGYLRAVRQVDDADWYFGLHFHLDPVMPGSLGIEAVIQTLQEWAVDAGLFAELREPEFVLPTGIELDWRYRGQILASDGEMTIETHVKRVEHGKGRVRVVADASVFKPGMRIYALTDIAVEARGKGAPPW